MSVGVGTIVHYVSHGTPLRADGTRAYEPCCRAAIVTQVSGRIVVGLAVLNPTGFFFHEAVGYVDRHAEARPVDGTWHETHVVDDVSPNDE